MKKILLLPLSLLLLLLAACSNTTAGRGDKDKLQIVATYSIIADMAENIAGDKAEVYSLVPVGTDPHMYDPLPADTSKVSGADLIFYNGMNLETGKGWFQDLLDVTNKNGAAFALTEAVTPIYLTEKGKESQVDPHAWLDIQNAVKYVSVITEQVIKQDPDNEAYYRSNQEKYVAELNSLDQYAKDAVQQLPEDKRILVTSEGAFKYFSQAYGLESAFIWEINTDSQGTPEQMSRIIGIIEDNSIPALFLETSVNPKTMETVSAETGVPIHSRIFTDSVAKDGEEGDTYLGMMQWNIDKVVEGLSGQ
ncbi:metal ABC transporter substrate-binding protein [Paenibacillus typhae]|uniref:Iron/zinc/copper transport system substrate-binding protein n=1 Tax=Paenibacillus typhae TaxID=1174501 RepID=A0A1G8NX65_9BACL|nr:metal ABC transporter substrate-binding protein [Paenibacillus typhae]SDI84793.1 iron/zinc/copper transport system substrate-binding protein [Paenibacillus typhae]